MSETALCRPRLGRYCTGYGLDIGYGGDPITPGAITVDMPQPYTKVGSAPLNLGGDARDLYWFKDETLDYVFSSHLLEDFPAGETLYVLFEWLRVLKIGGRLIIYCPDERIYSEHCKKTGQEHNPFHSIDNFSLDFLKEVLKKLKNTKIIHEAPLVDTYSFELVLEKTGRNTGVLIKKIHNIKNRIKTRIKTRLRPYLGPVKRKIMGFFEK